MTAPGPDNPNNLSRASLFGGVLAIIAIVLFVILWIMLGRSGVANAPRLIVSLCVPPALLAVIVGVYALAKR